MVRKKGYFMELVLYKGRPADCTGRLEKEIRTYDLLDALGLEYWRTDHAFLRADTMEDCMVIDDCLGATVCKNLFLCNRQKTNFYLLMMPGDKPFKTKELSHQLGISRLSFASPEDMEQYLDCTPGSSSVMGLANDKENKVQLLMDEAPRGTLPVEVEESLKQALGSEVNVAYHDGKGKLTVHFYSDEQLKAFANLLGQYQAED